MKALAICLLFAVAAPAARLSPMDHEPWDRILKEFVDERRFVDYARLKSEASARLDAYVAGLGNAEWKEISSNERSALLINAYNALTVHWIVQHYPLDSIWDTSVPFRKKRHNLGGRNVSLDEIESRLRETGDPRIHAALVCAARSCPPLRREAYAAARLDEQLDDNTRQWLANEELNRFLPAEAKAEVSPIFKWYRKDFDSAPGGLEAFLRKYGPAELPDRKVEIGFLSYDWGLNDQSGRGKDYGGLDLAVDWLKNWFRRLK